MSRDFTSDCLLTTSVVIFSEGTIEGEVAAEEAVSIGAVRVGAEVEEVGAAPQRGATGEEAGPGGGAVSATPRPASQKKTSTLRWTRTWHKPREGSTKKLTHT